MLAACVRFSMSRRPRPIESALESRLIDCVHWLSIVHDTPTLPAEHVPIVHTPGAVVTLGPADG